MMRAAVVCFLLGVLAVGFAPSPAHAAKPNPDVVRLSAQIKKLNADPVLGQYALAQRTLAHNAITALRNASHSHRAHALFMAEQRVALAEAAAKVGADRAKLDQLQQRHAQIMLQASQADAAVARAELARQRLQYQAAVEQTQMLQAQGAQAAQQAQQAQAEAEQAKQLAAAQARAARLARKEAKLAEAANKALQASKAAAGSAQNSSPLHLTAASFKPKSNDLTSAARQQVADFARAHASQHIIVEPHSSSHLRVLAGRRAVSVHAALDAAGAGNVTVWKVQHIDKGIKIEVRTEQ